MLVPVRLTPFTGLLLAALPLLAMCTFGLALPTLVGGEGGGAEMWHMAGGPGAYGLLMGLGIVGVTLVLSTLLRGGFTGQPAPLVVLVGLATLPWLLGLAGTQEAMRKVLAALPAVGGRDALTQLAAGTGEAMRTRLLGAWTSAALLLAVSVGLLMLHRQTRRSGEPSERMLGAALALALATTALLAAFEAHLLMEVLAPLATVASGSPTERLALNTVRLNEVQGLRLALFAALAILGLLLVGWQLFPRPEAVARWAGSLTLVAIAATVLVLDTRPLQLAISGVSRADAARPVLPLGMRQMLAQTLGTLPAGCLPTSPLRSEP